MRDRSDLLMPAIDRIARRCAAALALLAALASSPSFAADRWAGAAGGAVAILPVPTKANGISGGSLVCAEQQWSFRLRVDPSKSPQFGTEGLVTVESVKIPAKIDVSGLVVTLPVPFETIESLKAGTRLVFAFGDGKDAPGATFSLRGSKLVIEAIAPRCSQIDMTGYDRVSLLESGPAVEQARPLLVEEVELFRQATKSEPILTAATVDLPEGRGVLFASLCGSTWYYGLSGCTLVGYVRQTATSAWQQAFDNEGVALFIDPKAATGGWPNLVTLPLVNGMEATHWVWTGTLYQLRDHVVAEDELAADGVPEGEGDAAQ